MNMIKYLLKLKYIIVFQVFTALLSIVGIASMPYVVKLLFDYDFSKGVGLSNILDSELCRRKPAEGSHR